MEHALKLPGRNSLLVAIVAFLVGAGGATLTYAAADGASFDLTTGDGPVTKKAPHAGTSGGVTVKHAPVQTR